MKRLILILLLYILLLFIFAYIYLFRSFIHEVDITINNIWFSCAYIPDFLGYRNQSFLTSTMNTLLLLVLISVFQIVQFVNSTSNGLISSDLSLSKYYEQSAKNLLSERLSSKNLRISIDYEQF